MSSSTSSHAPGNREGVAKKRSVRPTEEEASELISSWYGAEADKEEPAEESDEA